MPNELSKEMLLNKVVTGGSYMLDVFGGKSLSRFYIGMVFRAPKGEEEVVAVEE